MASRRQLLLLPLALPAALAGAADAGDIVVVAGVASVLQPLTRSQAVGYFTGRLRALPSGEAAQPLDLPASHPVRERFYRLLTGLGPAQMNSYWSRLAFSGQMQPPQVVDGEPAMARLLRDNPRTLGYLARLPDDERLRVLLVLRNADG
jgi:hypothetical protein